MDISSVLCNFLIEMFVLTLITINWAQHQNITFFKFDAFFFKFLKLKILTHKNNVSLNFKKVSVNFFLKWNPIFKKSSYIGYYFSNIKKWQK